MTGKSAHEPLWRAAAKVGFEPRVTDAAKQLDDPLLQLGRIGDIYVPKVARFGR
jgi:hypothetical protein